MNIAEYLKSEEKDIKLYHDNGEVALSYCKNSDGFWNWSERTYDKNGNRKTYKNSNGFSCEHITYKDSNGVFEDYTVKEMTVEQIEKQLGYKIKIVE